MIGRRGAAAWVVCWLAAVLGLGGLVFVALGGDWEGFIASRQADAPLIAIVGGLFGALIVRQRPRNPVGWLFLVNAFCYGLHNLLEQYATYALRYRPGSLPGGALAAWMATPPLILAAAALALIILLFPNGIATSDRWRRAKVGTLAVTFGALCGVGIVSWPLRGLALLATSPEPAGSRGRAFLAVTGLSQAGLGACALLSLESLILRYRQATGVARQQLKWFALGAVPSIVLIIGYHFLGGLTSGLIGAVASVPLMVGITVAIVRHRLYDIDRLISRAVSYATLSILLAGVYLTAATLLGRVLGSVAGGSTLVTAGAAVVATAVFQPLRRAVQEEADRRFRRRSYRARAVIARYLDDIGDRGSEPGALGSALAASLDDPSAQVGLWLGSYERYVDESGADVTLPGPRSGQACTRIDRGREHLGVVVHRQALLEDEPELLNAVARAAGLALDHARLRAQVLVQLREVRASRARILAASDAERRRVERDLHDGAQQRLVVLGLTLRRLRSQADLEGADRLAEQLEQTAADVGAALTELRELARGLLPPILTEQGLLAAITSLAERTSVSSAVECDTDRRYPTPVETAAYYVVAEALANVVKHAHARRVMVTVTHRPDELHVTVSDDGVGGAKVAPGSGLSGLRDRVDAVEGRLSIDSVPGRGTRIAAELPI